MKKIFLLFTVISVLFLSIPKLEAQSPTPSVGKDWIYKPITAGALHTTKPEATITPFFKSENVDYIQVMVVYTGVTGDSCNLKFYASPDGTNFTSSFINRRLAFQWENGDGTSKIMCDTVTLTKYPIGSLKVVCDTLTRMTAGTVTVFIKPHFK